MRIGHSALRCRLSQASSRRSTQLRATFDQPRSAKTTRAFLGQPTPTPATSQPNMLPYSRHASASASRGPFSEEGPSSNRPSSTPVPDSHPNNIDEILARGLAARFGGSSSAFRVASFLPRTRAVFFPNWVARESAIGRSPIRIDDFSFHFSRWVQVGERARGYLRCKAWIRLRDWPILCWNREDVKAAVSGFGELWEVDAASDSGADVSYYRLNIRCQSVDSIPEVLELMVEDRRFVIPIEIESSEAANPILLGEGLDERLGLTSLEEQERFIRQTGFQGVPAFGIASTATSPYTDSLRAGGKLTRTRSAPVREEERVSERRPPVNIPRSTHWDRERSCPIAGAWTPILLRSMVGRPSRLGPSFCPLSFRVLWMPLLGLVRTVGHPVRTMGHPGSAPRVKSFYPVRTVGHLVRTVGHLGSAPRIKSFCLALGLQRSGKVHSYRRSQRLAEKNIGYGKTSLQRAQAILCKKVKLANLPSKVARASCVAPSAPSTSAGQPSLQQDIGRQLACTSGSKVPTDQETILKRDQALPLTPEEILLIKTVCGISDADSLLFPRLLWAVSSFYMARNRLFRFLTWNVRGLNDPSKCTIIKTFIRHCRCCVVCFQETKLSSTSLEKFRSFCGSHLHDFRTRDAEGTRGGLLTAWNSSLFDCIQEWKGAFTLTVLLKRKIDGATFMISNVYGPTDVTLKANFFQELRSIHSVSSGIWTLLGDFNVLLSVDDKNGDTAHVADILKFREVVHDLHLVDLPILNKAFTWTNGRGVPTLERLDRAFISTNWLLAFPRSTLRALPRLRSDHTPLVLTAFTFIPSANLFRFESFWLRHPAVFDVVSTAWNSTTSGLAPVNQFASKLKSIQTALRNWSVGLSSRLQRQASLCLLWIDWLDNAEERRSLTNLERALRPMLKVRGTNPDLSSLQEDFTAAEVRKAVFSSGPEKAPGPDGLPMLFYQRFWNLLKNDIMSVFNSFHNGSAKLDEINASWLCLIPKKSEALLAKDFRPISLVHGMGKLISKVLASRLQSFMAELINPHQAAFIKGRNLFDNFSTAHVLVHHYYASKQSAALLKIDFERAFDHINWDFLVDLLRARGSRQLG
uniref:Reverse transcriptase domain-containing protein n=1 Tax=Ananas comosus var. bracteatus TaxID=296719 RepID=A0A6V7P2A2_ANACO|nr:unnamed protein product [Ananas comosus var. bracteatus]